MNRKRGPSGRGDIGPYDSSDAVKRQHIMDGDGMSKPCNRTVEKKTRRYLGSVLSHCHRVLKAINEQLGSPIYMKHVNREFETGTGSTKKYDCDFQNDPAAAIENWVEDVFDLPKIVDARSLQAFTRCYSSLKGRDFKIDKGRSINVKESVKNGPVCDDTDNNVDGGSDADDDDDDNVIITVSPAAPSNGVFKPMIASSALFNSSNRSNSNTPRGSSIIARSISSTILRTDVTNITVSSGSSTGYSNKTTCTSSVAVTLDGNIVGQGTVSASEDLSNYVENVKFFVLYLLYIYLLLFLQQDEEVLSDPFNEQIVDRFRHSTILASAFHCFSLKVTTSAQSNSPTILKLLQEFGKNHQLDVANLLEERESKSLLQKLFVRSSEIEDIRKKYWIDILEGSLKIDFFSGRSSDFIMTESSPSITPTMELPVVPLGASITPQVDQAFVPSSSISSNTSSIGYGGCLDAEISEHEQADPYHIVPLSDPGTPYQYDEESSNNDLDIMSESDSGSEKDAIMNVSERIKFENSVARIDSEVVDENPLTRDVIQTLNASAESMSIATMTVFGSKRITFSQIQIQEMLGALNEIRDRCDKIMNICACALNDKNYHLSASASQLHPSEFEGR